MSSSRDPVCPHIVLLPSSGMGHLTPFLRLAASLTTHNVHLTLITAHPTVSLAESQALSNFGYSFPQVIQQEMHIPPINQTPAVTSDDPFTVHYEAIRRSSQLLSPLLSSLSPPVSAVITDMSLTSVIVPITKELNLPNYIFFTSSAKMLAIYASYHKLAPQIQEKEDEVRVPGLQPIPKSWLPPSLLSPNNNLLRIHFIENGEKFLESDGILTNTFEDFERESLTALNNGLVVSQLPPVVPIGPLSPCEYETGEVLTWLDDQSAGSILYVSFGSRAAISREQLQELGNGLVSSGYKFLWVIKGTKVDREDQEELEEMVGQDVINKVKQRGLMVKTWMNQEQILSHTAIGGFLSHCGWNSVTEAIWHGIPILAWPQSADQKINANLVETNMVGLWEKSWGWGGKKLIEGQKIAQKIREFMVNKVLRKQAGVLRSKARTAVESEGNSKNHLTALVEAIHYKRSV